LEAIARIEPPDGNRRRVLVVDHDVVFGHMVRDWIERRGIAADRVPDLDAALQCLLQQPYDLVLLDVGTLKPNGRALPCAVRKWLPDQEIFLLAEFPDRALLEGSARIGVPVIAKPFGPEALLDRIEALFEHTAMSRAATPVRD
jgi:two-component system response regulator HydG